MSSILVCINPTESHVGPVLTVAKGFVDKGWRVRVLTGARFADRVDATGATAIALPPEGDVLDSIDLKGNARGVKALNDGIYRTFIEPTPPQFQALCEALDAEPVDAVTGDPSFLAMSLLNSLPARPVLATCGIFPLMVSSVDTPPFGLGATPKRGAIGRLQHRMMSWTARKVILARVQRQIDEFYRSFGLPGLGSTFFTDYMLRDGMIDLLGQFTVPAFEYPRSDLPSVVRFFGPLSVPARPDWRPPEWWSELDGSRPVVHVSQGTVANTDFGELVGPTLEALADEPVLVVVATGRTDGRPIGDLPPLPANARVAEFLPHAELMPKVSAFVTNGGYGGLHEAMRHGVPIVVAGDTEDKLETSARVAWSGVGVNLKTGHPTREAIRAAVSDVLANPRFRDASSRIGEEIAASPGAAGFVDAVEELVAARASAPASGGA
ncbi:nucleotide disphospho-sugar-binding domain-containing protein [Agromyces humatus]|uniref:Glycosyltransferase n=1 Tax=Agromyces humatus TaxID=279573 RepID=A0ABP4WEJ4_9MICO|nr:nucleotide disphospho-sugar-binding domain-containing protein [Agromyces humatus]